MEQIPNPRKTDGNWVSDVANILRPATEKKLNALIHQLQATTGSEVAVATLPDSTPFATPKEVATKLFKAWGIGQKGKDNGLLFLISVGDRRVEIETGYGLEAILPDAKVGQIIEERIAPEFKKGDFDAGTLSGIEAIAQVLQGKDRDLSADAPHSSGLDPWFDRVIFGIAMIIIFSTWGSLFFRGIGRSLVPYLQGLAGLAFVRGLGQSVKILPSHSSRKKESHLTFDAASLEVVKMLWPG